MAMEMIYVNLHHKADRTFRQNIYQRTQQIEKFQISDIKSNWMYRAVSQYKKNL